MSVAGQKRRREDDAIDEVGDGGVGRDEVANGLNPVKLMAEPAELMAEPAKVMAGVKCVLAQSSPGRNGIRLPVSPRIRER